MKAQAPEPSIERVREARRRIAPYVVRTPMIRHALGRGSELLLKPESLQPTGAFKLRGAFNLMAQLPRGIPGVVAHSSGNHAQAVAYAARALGLHAVIVMPDDAPQEKRRRTESCGAELVIVGPDSDERAARAEEIARERGLVPVPPYDDPRVAAGQGTAALELLEDAGSLDRFYAPVSGGGLLAGCAVVLASLAPEAEIVAVEPEGADHLAQSLAAGERRKVPPPRTIADGLRVRMVGASNWPVLRRTVRRVALVSDPELVDAMAFSLRELRLVLEPSGAAALAVALRERPPGRSGVMLTGGNVDPELLARAAALRSHQAV